MKPFLTISFPRSGRIYQVPTEAVVADWVSEHTITDPGRTPEQYAFEARQLFADDFEMIKWIRESMTWRDLLAFAVLVGQQPSDLEAEFEDATLAPVAESMPAPDTIAPEDLLESPIGLYVAMMAKVPEHCRINVLTSGEKRVAGIVLIRGPEEIIDGFIGTIASYDDMLRKMAALAAADAMGEAPSTAQH